MLTYFQKGIDSDRVLYYNINNKTGGLCFMKDRFFTDEELLEPKSRRDILKENLQRVLKADAENVTELDDITYSSEEDLTDILSTSCIHVAMKDGEGKIYDVYHFGPVYASTDKTEKGDKLVNDATLQGYTIILKSGARSKTNINNNLRIVSGGVDVKGKSSSGNYALRSFQPSDSWDGLMPTHSAGALKKTETTDVLLPYPSAKTDAKKNELYNAFFKTIQLDIEEKAKREKAPAKVVKVNENLPEFIEFRRGCLWLLGLWNTSYCCCWRFKSSTLS